LIPPYQNELPAQACAEALRRAFFLTTPVKYASPVLRNLTRQAKTQRRKEGIIIIVFLILSQGEKRVKKRKEP
jgi:hypothetical protein